jgi:hypothetical protein
VCRCEDRVVQRLEQDFKVTLQQQNSLEQWAAWLDGVVSQVLKPYQGSSGFPKAAKLFLLKWSFYRCAPGDRGCAVGWGPKPRLPWMGVARRGPAPGRRLRCFFKRADGLGKPSEGWTGADGVATPPSAPW